MRKVFDYEHYARCPSCYSQFLKILKFRICKKCGDYLRFTPRTAHSRKKMMVKRY